MIDAMASTDSPLPAQTCLDIAIDHRLVLLFKPTHLREKVFTSNHIPLIRNLGGRLRRGSNSIPQTEINVTAEIAQPCGSGGILTILQQPAKDHPYDDGTATTIAGCATYMCLKACFEAVSLNTISLGDISVVDSLPYVRRNDQLDARSKLWLRNEVYGIAQAKMPAAVLCMWKDSNGVPPRMQKLCSQGVGKRFPSREIELKEGFETRRVSAFHPSYAMFHKPTASCLRQLLLLEIAQTCALANGEWIEEDWMTDLRMRCAAIPAGDLDKKNQHFKKSVEYVKQAHVKISAQY